MQIDLSTVIALCSLCASAGMAVGMVTGRFVTVKACRERTDKCNAERVESRREIWAAIDSIREAMMGGAMTFEVSIQPKRKVAVE